MPGPDAVWGVRVGSLSRKQEGARCYAKTKDDWRLFTGRPAASVSVIALCRIMRLKGQSVRALGA